MPPPLHSASSTHAIFLLFQIGGLRDQGQRGGPNERSDGLHSLHTTIHAQV